MAIEEKNGIKHVSKTLADGSKRDVWINDKGLALSRKRDAQGKEVWSFNKPDVLPSNDNDVTPKDVDKLKSNVNSVEDYDEYAGGANVLGKIEATTPTAKKSLINSFKDNSLGYKLGYSFSNGMNNLKFEGDVPECTINGGGSNITVKKGASVKGSYIQECDMVIGDGKTNTQIINSTFSDVKPIKDENNNIKPLTGYVNHVDLDKTNIGGKVVMKDTTARNVKNLADSKIHNSSLLGNDNIANAEIKDSDLKGSAITNSKVTKTTMFVPKNSNLDYSDLNNVTIDNRDVTENELETTLPNKKEGNIIINSNIKNSNIHANNKYLVTVCNSNLTNVLVNDGINSIKSNVKGPANERLLLESPQFENNEIELNKKILVHDIETMASGPSDKPFEPGEKITDSNVNEKYHTISKNNKMYKEIKSVKDKDSVITKLSNFGNAPSYSKPNQSKDFADTMFD